MTCTQTCGSATKNNSKSPRIPPAGYNWIKWNQLKKLLKIKTIVTHANKINNYFCLEVNYSCGNLLRHYTVIIFSLLTISTIRISRKHLSLSQQNYMKSLKGLFKQSFQLGQSILFKLRPEFWLLFTKVRLEFWEIEMVKCWPDKTDCSE